MEYFMEDKAFDLAIMECEQLLLSSQDKFEASYMEAVLDGCEDMFCEFAWEDLKSRISELAQKLIHEIIEFCKKLKVQIDIKVQQIQLNRKLTELKDIMAKKRSRIVNKHYSYFDIQKYKKYYTEFINRYTAELKAGMNKDFSSVEEYEKWKIGMMNKLSDFNYKLSDEEQWKLSVSINSAVKLSEEEASNREKNMNMVKDHGTDAIKSLENYYKSLSVEKSLVNYNSHQIKIFNLKNSFLGIICSKIAQFVKTVIRIITKHTFLCVTGLLVVLIAM